MIELTENRYRHIRSQTELLCKDLQPEDTIAQAEEFTSPVKWHLAHSTWFFETFVLQTNVRNYQAFNPDFHFLFNSYYESLGERVARNRRGLLSRPLIEEVYRYRHHVDAQMKNIFASEPDKELLATIELGLQHEQQHQELLVTDTKYMFSQNPLLPAWEPKLFYPLPKLEKKETWLTIKEGLVTIGNSNDNFCFDNELGVHQQYLRNFFIASQPVSNAEYLEFIKNGAYQNFKYWLADGWNWVVTSKSMAPLYWQYKNNDWLSYGFKGLEKINPDLPVIHLNYYEADAFARWKEMRLPTEFEHETAAKLYPEYFKPAVWEWTQSAYLPYPDFKIAGGAVGEYNGKFMSNQMVLRGASIATAENHSRPSYRNFFSPHLQWQFSGLRLVKDKQ